MSNRLDRRTVRQANERLAGMMIPPQKTQSSPAFGRPEATAGIKRRMVTAERDDNVTVEYRIKIL
jgi:hypothetical protein